MPADIAITAPPPLSGMIEPTVEVLIKATGIDFRIGGNRAFYAPTEDYVQFAQATRGPGWHDGQDASLSSATKFQKRLKLRTGRFDIS